MSSQQELSQMLYLQQKFQILALFKSTDGRQKITPRYAFAWYEGVFPLLEESAEWHRPYADFFGVSKNMVEELFELLCDCWEKKRSISFYGLEEHYDLRGGESHWERHSLIAATRYLWLGECFDEEFWGQLLERTQHPAEAVVVTHPFTPEDAFFL